MTHCKKKRGTKVRKENRSPWRIKKGGGRKQPQKIGRKREQECKKESEREKLDSLYNSTPIPSKCSGSKKNRKTRLEKTTALSNKERTL